MPRDPLDALLRLRHLAQEDAVRDLAACMACSAAAAEAVAGIDASIGVEEAAASTLESDDVAVESFGRWLHRIRQERAAAVAACDRADAATVRARAVLGAARAALRGVETELSRRADDARTAALRQEQAVIDEHAGRRRD